MNAFLIYSGASNITRHLSFRRKFNMQYSRFIVARHEKRTMKIFNERKLGTNSRIQFVSCQLRIIEVFPVPSFFSVWFLAFWGLVPQIARRETTRSDSFLDPKQERSTLGGWESSVGSYPGSIPSFRTPSSAFLSAVQSYSDRLTSPRGKRRHKGKTF